MGFIFNFLTDSCILEPVLEFDSKAVIVGRPDFLLSRSPPFGI